MLFHTYEYAVFLIVVVYCWYRLSGRHRIAMLTGASFLFYGVWSVKYSLLMVVSAVLDYITTNRIARATNPNVRRAFLLLSVIGNLSLLAYFKYTNFAIDSARQALLFMGFHVPAVELQIILPLGISFYTFDEISYTVDVYRGRMRPVPSLLVMLSFVSFFPQLVAGPLQRSWHLVPQIEREPVFDWLDIRIGVNLILWGLFKKVVLADNLGVFADRVFATPEQYSSLAVLLGVYAFAFQIYFDFSAYSHMAMGSARLLGVRFTKNFDLPYLARDISEFWRRWHITLSTWLRDYLYIPLGGSKRGELRTTINLMLTMLIGGVWHGANWTFVVWGGYHGALLAMTRYVRGRFETGALGRLASALPALWVAVTFNLVCVGWIVFRAPTIRTAANIMRQIVAFRGAELQPEFVVLAIVLAGAMIGHAVAGSLRRRADLILAHASPALDVAYCCSIVLLLTVFGYSGVAKFIYFEF